MAVREALGQMSRSSGAEGARRHHTWSRSDIRYAEMTAEGSGRGAIVVAQQSAQESLTSDLADVGRCVEREFLQRPRRCVGHCPVSQPLVWAMLVEEANVFLADVVEMP